jgi:hypothetical protein
MELEGIEEGSTTGEEPAAERSVLSQLFDRRRMKYIALVLVIEIAIFLAGLLTPVSVSARQSLASTTNTQFGNLTAGTPVQLAGVIFTHNLTIALLEMIPILGDALFVFSIYTTGLIAQALVASNGLPGLFGAVILIFPYSLVELSAYAVAVVAGASLLVAWRRGRLRREAKVFTLQAFAVTVILLAAATMEATTIKVSLLLGLALWLPTGLLLAGIIVLSTRRWK